MQKSLRGIRNKMFQRKKKLSVPKKSRKPQKIILTLQNYCDKNSPLKFYKNSMNNTFKPIEGAVQGMRQPDKEQQFKESIECKILDWIPKSTMTFQEKLCETNKHKGKAIVLDKKNDTFDIDSDMAPELTIKSKYEKNK
ncbi:unnamed protein product [Moneuplotes crassus]|uniref:Uncharacterized protein n=1 Tax=Euplotes crassus TaxID=5936 RepID=A0AAD1UJE6_EUPCR|nr:unnamed protein product [Moneuplotes crassus]